MFERLNSRQTLKLLRELSIAAAVEERERERERKQSAQDGLMDREGK